MKNPFKKSFGQQVLDAALGMVPGMEKTWLGGRRWNPAKALGQVLTGAVIGGAQFCGKAIGVAAVNAFQARSGKAAAGEAPLQQPAPRQETTRRPEGQRARHVHVRETDIDEQAAG